MSLANRKNLPVPEIVPRTCPDCGGVLFEYREPIRTYKNGRHSWMLAQEWLCWRDGYYDASNFPLLTEEQRELSKNMFRSNIQTGILTETLFKKTVRVYPPFEAEILKKDYLPEHLREKK